MSNSFQIFISLFSILNPILAITIYLDITNGLKPAEKKSVAVICGVSVFAILTGFLFIGQPLLNVLGIHDFSLQLAGGLIVLLIGISMIMKPSEKIEESKNSERRNNSHRIKSLGISPLALPMIVGPAAIVMVILYGQQEQSLIGKLMIVGILALVSLSVIVVFMLADYIAKAIGDIGIIALTKIMGLIIAAIAIEMLVNGLKVVVPLVAHNSILPGLIR